jgi:hypothetical protein
MIIAPVKPKIDSCLYTISCYQLLTFLLRSSDLLFHVVVQIGQFEINATVIEKQRIPVTIKGITSGKMGETHVMMSLKYCCYSDK